MQAKATLHVCACARVWFGVFLVSCSFWVTSCVIPISLPISLVQTSQQSQMHNPVETLSAQCRFLQFEHLNDKHRHSTSRPLTQGQRSLSLPLRPLGQSSPQKILLSIHIASVSFSTGFIMCCPCQIHDRRNRKTRCLNSMNPKTPLSPNSSQSLLNPPHHTTTLHWNPPLAPTEGPHPTGALGVPRTGLYGPDPWWWNSARRTWSSAGPGHRAWCGTFAPRWVGGVRWEGGSGLRVGWKRLEGTWAAAINSSGSNGNGHHLMELL